MAMRENLTRRAEKAIAFAEREAKRLGSSVIDPQHLLLGLIYEQDSIAAKSLVAAGWDLAKLRSLLSSKFAEDGSRWPHAPSLSITSKRIIDLAGDQAQWFRNSHTGTEHILLGLMLEPAAGPVLGIEQSDKDRLLTAVMRQIGFSEEEITSKTPAPIETSAPVRQSTKDFLIEYTCQGVPKTIGWGNLTPYARRAMWAARKEANERKVNLVEPEHILLVLVNLEDTTAKKIFTDLGIDTANIAANVASKLKIGNVEQTGEMKLSAQGKQVIRNAYTEVRRLQSRYIGTEHFVLGLLRTDGNCRKILGEANVSYPHFYRQTAVEQGIWPAPPLPKDEPVKPRISETVHQNAPIWQQFFYLLLALVVLAVILSIGR